MCLTCHVVVSEREHRVVAGGYEQSEIKSDWLNRIKERFKRKLGRLYPFMIELLSPVHAARCVPRFLRSFDLDHQLVADLGAGTSSYRESVVCIDGVDYPNVHVVADLCHLPLAGEALDGLISTAVLEHVTDPRAHVAEMKRVLRVGGRLCCYVPFMQGFHASPYDFQRYTIPGLRELFRDFEVIETQVGAGPTSGMLWILQEWLAMVLSLGSLRLYRLFLPMMWVLSPLKFLDLLLIHHRAAGQIASGFTILARKRGSSCGGPA